MSSVTRCHTNYHGNPQPSFIGVITHILGVENLHFSWFWGPRVDTCYLLLIFFSTHTICISKCSWTPLANHVLIKTFIAFSVHYFNLVLSNLYMFFQSTYTIDTNSLGVLHTHSFFTVNHQSPTSNFQAPAPLGPSRWKLLQQSWYLLWIPGSQWKTSMEKIWKLCSLKSRLYVG